MKVKEFVCREEVNLCGHVEAPGSQCVHLRVLLKLGTQKPGKEPLVLTV
jgi:hypothetical protein